MACYAFFLLKNNLVLFNLISHTFIQCILITFIQHSSSDSSYWPHSTSLPTSCLPTVAVIDNLLGTISTARMYMAVGHALGHRQLLVATARHKGWFFLPQQPTTADSYFINSETFPHPCWNSDGLDLVHVLYREAQLLQVDTCNSCIMPRSQYFAALVPSCQFLHSFCCFS